VRPDAGKHLDLFKDENIDTEAKGGLTLPARRDLSTARASVGGGGRDRASARGSTTLAPDQYSPRIPGVVQCNGSACAARSRVSSL